MGLRPPTQVHLLRKRKPEQIIQHMLLTFQGATLSSSPWDPFCFLSIFLYLFDLMLFVICEHVRRPGRERVFNKTRRKAFHLLNPLSKVMLKILQATLQQYVNRELPDVQAGFRKGRGTRDQIANICWIIEKAREFQKNICFIDYAKAFDYVDHNKLWKILKQMGIPDHLTCLLRNLYAGQEATVRTGQGTTDWFQIRKGVLQGCILSPYLFNLYAEYIMGSAGLNEAEAGIKISGRNTNNLRYADDIPPYGRK